VGTAGLQSPLPAEEGSDPEQEDGFFVYAIAIFKSASSSPSEEDQEPGSDAERILDHTSTFLRIFPPSESHQPTGTTAAPGMKHDRAVIALLTGSDTLSCPSDHVIVNLQTRVAKSASFGSGSESEPPLAEQILTPYLTTLSSSPPLYAAFYPSLSPQNHTPPPPSSPFSLSVPKPAYIPLPPPPISKMPIAEIGDACAKASDKTFWEVLDALKQMGVDVASLGRDDLVNAFGPGPEGEEEGRAGRVWPLRNLDEEEEGE